MYTKQGLRTALYCVFLLYLETVCTESTNSFTGDWLTPYKPGHHGARRPISSVRELQGGFYGNKTHESFPAHHRQKGEPLMEVRHFIDNITSDKGEYKVIYGHYVIINDPMTLSVLEPGSEGGCQRHERETVVNSTVQKQCIMGMNAGFFDVITGACLGNVISDGRLVQAEQTDTQNVNFGLQKNESMIFGYLSHDEVVHPTVPYLQLVGGVIWLLRNGKVYINESKMIELDNIDEMDAMNDFINEVSARVAVGHDKDGRLILVQVDGKSNFIGVSLWEFAYFLQRQGIINAINLDGGGSATTVVNKTVTGYPSDYCSTGSIFRCSRKVTTILCV
ncbi:N-acetylglucosamine-1-phosphodiester alpha-N-acetylglucosaminidase-like [Glandiceps talaboti]